MTKPLAKPTMVSGIKPPALAKPAAREAKKFSVQVWTDAGQGTKTLIYGDSGMGKTTLASMAPNPIFIGVDDGGRKIRNPKTGQPVNAVAGVESFDDIRDALHQSDLFPVGSTIVIDTITKVQMLAEPYVFRTVKNDRGETIDSLEGYGYGKGYNHLLDAMRLILADLEPHVRRGVHVLMLAQQGQATITNLEGMDYLRDGPALHQQKNGIGVRNEVCGWMDNVFRIGHPEVSVVKASKTATKGKVSGSTERVIYTSEQLHYVAKNRMNGTLADAVSFETPADNSIWRFLYPETA